jgi:hypothetical protein
MLCYNIVSCVTERETLYIKEEKVVRIPLALVLFPAKIFFHSTGIYFHWFQPRCSVSMNIWESGASGELQNGRGLRNINKDIVLTNNGTWLSKYFSNLRLLYILCFSNKKDTKHFLMIKATWSSVSALKQIYLASCLISLKIWPLVRSR